MLGSRTKQVNSYGKRSQRIISVSETSSKTASSIFDDLPPTRWGPVASKMKKRSENMVVSKPKATSPKAIPVNRKKQSPVAQPLRQKLMRAQVDRKTSNSRQIEGTPVRAPLAAYPLNTPGSPAVPAGLLRKKARVSSARGTPLHRPRSPVVEMDIIVLDAEGQTVSRERRVSRAKDDVSDSSEDEAELLRLKKPKRLRKRAALVVSDESSEEESELPSKAVVVKAKPIKPPLPRTRKPPKPIPPRTRVEVIIPPPSPPLAAIIKAAPPISLEATEAFNASRYHPLSPLIRPRQLTPIRSRGNIFAPPSPPSPLSDSELDLSLDFSQLDLGTSALHDGSTLLHAAPIIPDYLRPLLEECQQAQTGLHEFSAFIETFPFDPVVRLADHSTSKPHDLKFRKVGEASYSEVFGIGDVVLKVIPIRDESNEVLSGSRRSLMKARTSDQNSNSDGPPPSDAKDVLKEVIVTRAMGDVCEGFVKLLKAYVVRGRYPEVLLELWDHYLEKNGSESIRPDTFNVSQTYAIIVLPNGGPDLETYSFSGASKTGWRQASSIFWQVAKALAQAEQLVSFEHRDLHWGQILIKDTPVPSAMPMQEQRINIASRTRPAKAPMDDPSHGVHATLIDLGLARMDAGDGAGGEMVHWTALDDEIFMGEGDYQFDIYRMMRDQNKGQWESFNPLTNVMWLHYLLVKLLHSKRLRAPASPRRGQAQVSSASQFSERDCYECLTDLDQWLGHYMSTALERSKPVQKPKGRKKPQPSASSDVTPSSGPLCAGEIVAYGVKKGWIKQPVSSSL